uniref:Alpha-1,6-mannosyl-glycoprotein 2-beta-N-acetylglucosaminyltransferase n=1 Tax=Globodera pallida TaxID=36090 RepID=A0A183CGP1_GLOPA
SIRGLYNLTNFAVPTSSNVDFVIIVQIHDRVKYLNALIQSLSKVANIDRVLLVFSCDFNSDEIHNLIRGIKFCKTLRITFPFNIQRYEHEFPGQSPSDCSEDGKNINCTNFNSTDIKGQHRKANLAQIKHHWWWKLNYMFELVMPKFGLENKFLVLLEEDHIVAPDFLHTLRLIVENRKNFCSGCELICLGAYPNSFNNYAENANKLAVEVWFSSKNNMGMVIDEQLWRKIQNCSKLSIQCLPKKLEVIYTESPRVIHIGDCGVHWHKCENDHRSLDLALDLFKSANASFFPSKLEVLRTSKRMFGVPSAANGGWADPRDQRLCELNTHPLAVDDPRLVLIKARAVLDGEN